MCSYNPRTKKKKKHQRGGMGGNGKSQTPTTITKSSSFLLNLSRHKQKYVCLNYFEIKRFGGFDPSLPFFIFFQKIELGHRFGTNLKLPTFFQKNSF